MPLNLPNLDDRDYNSLVQEALALIPAHAPEWTDHNPSDPGITLVELFAYLTEMLIYRVNRVTDTNYLTFLKLLRGPNWTPSPSRTLTEQIREAVLELREANRAVTCEDFERLAREADSRVARSHCIPRRNLEAEASGAPVAETPGHISVMIVPFAEAVLASDTELLQKVREYLEPRRLLTTQVHIVSPRYVSFGIQLTLVLKPDMYEDPARSAAIQALQEFYDPLTGGENGEGWLFGRSAYVSELYQLLDTLPGIDYVTRSMDPQTNQPLEEFTADPSRALRNEQGDLIAIKLQPNELIDPAQLTFNLTIQRPQGQS